MLFSQLLTAAVVAASASAFQPDSDYDVYKTTNLYNCSGRVPVSNVTARNAADTLPQIEPSTAQGWEQWTLFLHGTFSAILRWNQGNPSSSAPFPAHFDVLANINGTTLQYTVDGSLSYTDGGHTKTLAIGDNILTWDSEALWYNVSISFDGYHLELDSFSPTRDAFHPNVASFNGLLDQTGAWFGSIPLIRGHVVGSLSMPTKENITMDGLTVLRHIFSQNPLPDYIDGYTGGTVWGHSTAFYDTHVFYQTDKTNGTVHEAAYLSRAIPTPGKDGVFSSTWGTYAVTDDALYTLEIDSETHTFNASFSGCATGNDVPYQFNASSLVCLGELVDAAGGVTTYWTINGTTTAPGLNGTVAHGAIAGLFEEYVAPCYDEVA